MKFVEQYKQCLKVFENKLTLDDLRGIDFNKIFNMLDLDQDSAKAGNELVTVDMDKLDKILKDTDESYVDNQGRGGNPEKFQNAINFFGKGASKIQNENYYVQAPVIIVDEKSAHVVEGRHRLAILRGIGGLKQIKVAMDSQSIENAKNIGLI